MSNFLAWTLAAYCFVAQFGSLFRYGLGEGALGASTFLAVLLILLGVSRIPGQLKAIPVLWAFTLLFAWFALSSALSHTGPLGAYRSLAMLVLYLCLAASISSVQFTEKQLRRVAYAIAIGLLLSSSLTIIDFQGWANVPRCNLKTVSTHVEGLSTKYIIQAAGFFPRRTGMAAVFSLSVTMSVILTLSAKGWISKGIYAAAALSGSFAILLSHNRSGVVAVAFSVGTYFLFSNIITFSTRMKVGVVGSVLAVVFLFLANTYYPDHVDVYKRKFSFLVPGANKTYTKSQSSADSVRKENFKIAIKELGNNPFGQGLGRIPHPDRGLIDPHNVYTALLWAGGIFTLVWTLPFGITFFKTLFAKVPMAPEALPYFDALRFSILGFIFNNMAHNSLGTGLFWIFLATIISVKYLGIGGFMPMQQYGGYPMPMTRRAGSY